MKKIFYTLGLVLVTMYVLVDSNTVEFTQTTLGKTELVERVGVTPSFHADRLEPYFRKRWQELQGLAKGLLKGTNP